jgi:hypothetical protein
VTSRMSPLYSFCVCGSAVVGWLRIDGWIVSAYIHCYTSLLYANFMSTIKNVKTIGVMN